MRTPSSGRGRRAPGARRSTACPPSRRRAGPRPRPAPRGRVPTRRLEPLPGEAPLELDRLRGEQVAVRDMAGARHRGRGTGAAAGDTSTVAAESATFVTSLRAHQRPLAREHGTRAGRGRGSPARSPGRRSACASVGERARTRWGASTTWRAGRRRPGRGRRRGRRCRRSSRGGRRRWRGRGRAPCRTRRRARRRRRSRASRASWLPHDRRRGELLVEAGHVDDAEPSSRRPPAPASSSRPPSGDPW